LASPGHTALERIRKVAEDSRKYIQKREGIDLFCLDEPVMTLDDATRAASLFRRSEVDAVVVQHGTHSPASLSVELIRDLEVPLAAWAVPEAPFDGSQVPCGGMTSLLAHAAALAGIGRRFTFVQGLADSEEARKQLDRFIRATLVRGALRRAKIALVGYPSTTCLGCAFDKLAIKDLLGIEIDHIALSDVIEEVNALPDEEIEADMTELRSHDHLVEVSDPGALRRSCAAFAAIRKILVRGGFAAAAIKCRPELIGTHKLGMSAVCSRLTDAGIPACSEGDVDGALTMLVQQAYTGRPTFLADWVQRDDKTNQVLFWHEGTAPTSLANPKFQPKITNGYRDEDNVVFEFPLKSGEVTVARLLPRDGRYRMLVAGGRAVEPPQALKGTHVSIRFEAAAQKLLATILEHGFPQHYAIVYEDIKDEIIELAYQVGIEVISPEPDET